MLAHQRSPTSLFQHPGCQSVVPAYLSVLLHTHSVTTEFSPDDLLEYAATAPLLHPRVLLTHRLLPRLLPHVPCPLTHIQQQQQQHQHDQQLQELLALSVLRALQLHPVLSSHWRCSLWFSLLQHPLPLVRWCAVSGVCIMLGAADAVSSRLLQAHLSTQQQVEAMARWVWGWGGVWGPTGALGMSLMNAP